MKRINWLWATWLMAMWAVGWVIASALIGSMLMLGLTAASGVVGVGFGQYNHRHRVAARERPLRNPRVSSDDRHATCLAETNRMERELGLLSALSESEFDREVERAIGKLQDSRQVVSGVTMPQVPCCEEHSEQWWREKSWEIWRQSRRY